MSGLFSKGSCWQINTAQQAVSLIEKCERCPSLDTFIKYVEVMGLEIMLVSKKDSVLV